MCRKFYLASNANVNVAVFLLVTVDTARGSAAPRSAFSLFTQTRLSPRQFMSVFASLFIQSNFFTIDK